MAKRSGKVTVRHADGTVEVRSASSFRKKPQKSTAPKKRRPKGPRTYSRAQHLALDAELDDRIAREAAETPPEH